MFAYPNIYGFYPNKIVWVPNLNTFFIDAFMMSRTVFLFVQIIFLQCKIAEAVKQSGKIIQGHGLQETTVILVTALF